MHDNYHLTAPRAGGAAIGLGMLILIVGLFGTSTFVSFVNSSNAALTGNADAQSLLDKVPVFWILFVVGVGLGLMIWGAVTYTKAHRAR